MVESIEIFYLVVFLIFSGLYSGSESVLLTVGVDKARKMLEADDGRSGIYQFMIDHTNELITTILVGNNIVNIVTASLVTVITNRFFDGEVISVAVGITTLLILIFGEVIPKTIGMANARALSFYVLWFLKLNYYLLYPLVKVMTWGITLLLGKRGEIKESVVKKGDIAYMVSKAEREKTIDSKQLDMLSNILEFPTIKVKDIMIPRNRVKFIKADSSRNEILEYVKADIHSRYPVVHEDLDNYIGFLHVKDLAFTQDALDLKIESIVKKPFFVYEHMKIQVVFEHMNRRKVHLAMVKDENGMVVGIITLEDIIEEILGEIHDEHDLELTHTVDKLKLADSSGGLLLDGSISLRDLDGEYEINIPLNPHYSTLAGFLLDNLGNTFPKNGQIIVWGGYSFELVKVEEYEIREIRIRHLEESK